MFNRVTVLSCHLKKKVVKLLSENTVHIECVKTDVKMISEQRKSMPFQKDQKQEQKGALIRRDSIIGQKQKHRACTRC